MRELRIAEENFLFKERNRVQLPDVQLQLLLDSHRLGLGLALLLDRELHLLHGLSVVPPGGLELLVLLLQPLLDVRLHQVDLEAHAEELVLDPGAVQKPLISCFLKLEELF